MKQNNRLAMCPFCRGTGLFNRPGEYVCDTCGGLGEVDKRVAAEIYEWLEKVDEDRAKQLENIDR